jgi:hypothetical protein
MEDNDVTLVEGVAPGSDRAGRALLQPLMLRKAASTHDDDDDDDGDDDRQNDSKKTQSGGAAGTIVLEVSRVLRIVYVQTNRSDALFLGVTGADPNFAQRSVAADKKASFGVERSAAAGPAFATSMERKALRYVRVRGDLVGRLEVSYRTPKFFRTLQAHIDARRGPLPPSGSQAHIMTHLTSHTHTHHRTRTGVNMTATTTTMASTTVLNLVDDEDEEDEEERRTKKRIKCEPLQAAEADSSSSSSTLGLARDASVDTFLTRLAEYGTRLSHSRCGVCISADR